MLTVVRFNKHAHHLIKLQRNTRVVSEFKALPVRRYFSTEPPPIKPDESSNTNQPKEQIPSNKTTSTPTPTPNPLMSVFRFLSTNLQQAYDEMTGKSKQSAIKRTVFQADSYRPPKKKVGEDGEEIEDELYEGPTSIVLVKDPISAWEHMRNRLHDSPLIQSILRGSNKVGKVVLETELGKGVQNASNKVKDKIEDAREYWETTQNPIVYTIANAWDSLTSETEEGMTITQIRKLDPQFMKEEWAEEVKKALVPRLLKAFFLGDIKSLKPVCGEAVYNKLSADIRARKTDGLKFDSNLLSIDQNQLVLKLVEETGPVIVGVYMVQQINCIRNRKGEIVEGAENDIRAKFYSLAFKQEYIEEESAVAWKIIDFMFVGDIPYM